MNFLRFERKYLVINLVKSDKLLMLVRAVSHKPRDILNWNFRMTLPTKNIKIQFHLNLFHLPFDILPSEWSDLLKYHVHQPNFHVRIPEFAFSCQLKFLKLFFSRYFGNIYFAINEDKSSLLSTDSLELLTVYSLV